jgi:hypothetical protein
MGLTDRPDGTMPVSPVTVSVEGSLIASLMADLGGRLYTIPQLVEPVDHRGRVVWYDRLGYDPVRYAQVSSGVSAAVARDNAYAYEGEYCLAITAGPAAGNYTAITRGLPELAACTLGLEIRSMYLPPVPGSPARELFIYHYTGAVKYTFGWRYRDEDPPGVDVYTSGGWEEVAAVLAMTGEAVWNAIKMAVNLDDPAYLRGILDSREYDLSSYPVDSAADATGRGIMIEVRNTLLDAGDEIVYLGRLVVTDREPTS